MLFVRELYISGYMVAMYILRTNTYPLCLRTKAIIRWILLHHKLEISRKQTHCSTSSRIALSAQGIVPLYIVTVRLPVLIESIGFSNVEAALN